MTVISNSDSEFDLNGPPDGHNDSGEMRSGAEHEDQAADTEDDVDTGGDDIAHGRDFEDTADLEDTA